MPAWLWRAAAIAGGAAAAVTLMACYGVPCAGGASSCDPAFDFGSNPDLRGTTDLRLDSDGGAAVDGGADGGAARDLATRD